MKENLNNRSVILITGSDSMKFLQNLLTNDIDKNIYSYNYVVNNQARYLFDCFIYHKSDDEFFVDIESDNVKLFIEYLQKYKFRAKVNIEDLTKIYGIIYSKTYIECFFCAQDPRCNLMGFRSIVLRNELLFGDHTMNLYLNDKYSFTIIEGIDLIYSKSIICEYAIEELNAISYNKGCYIEQEVISRTKYQGIVRKKIFKIELCKNTASSINLIKQGSKIFANNVKIGVICSMFKNIAIGLVREEELLSDDLGQVTVENIHVTLSKPVWRK